MKKIVTKTQINYGEPVRRECPTMKGHFYEDRPVKSKTFFDVEIDVCQLNDFLYYKYNGIYYGKNCESINLSELEIYFKKFEGWKNINDVN